MHLAPSPGTQILGCCLDLGVRRGRAALLTQNLVALMKLGCRPTPELLDAVQARAEAVAADFVRQVRRARKKICE